MWNVRFSKVFAVQILSRKIILVICILLCCVIPVGCGIIHFDGEESKKSVSRGYWNYPL